MVGLVISGGCMRGDPDYSLNNYQLTERRVRQSKLFPDSLEFVDLDGTGPGSVGSTKRIIDTIDELCSIKPKGIRKFKSLYNVIETVYVETEKADCLEIIKKRANES